MKGFSYACFSKRRDGFTLTEVVVSSAVMIVVFVAIFGALSTSRRLLLASEKRLECAHFAREKLESIFQSSYHDPELDPAKQQQYNVPDKSDFTLNYKVTQVQNQNVRDVQVVVEWREQASGMTQSVTLKTSHSKSLHK